MSEQQLKRTLVDKEKLQDELSNLKNIIKVSAACENLLKFVKETVDPFSPDFPSEQNPWHSKNYHGGSCCIIS